MVVYNATHKNTGMNSVLTKKGELFRRTYAQTRN